MPPDTLLANSNLPPGDRPPTQQQGQSDQVDQSKTVASYQDKVSAAGKYYEEQFVKRADRLSHMYEINHYYDEMLGREPKPDRDRIKVPYPYSNARQILAEIYKDLPDVVVKQGQKAGVNPQTGEPIDLAQGAETLKQAMDYVKRKSNMARSVKKAALDGIATGIGCIQLVAQKNTKIPKFVRKMYREVLWDCTNVLDLYESEWIACKLIRPLEEIKNDPMYDEKVRQNVPAARLDEKIYGKSEIMYGVLWEIFDKKNDVYLVYADGQSDALFLNPMTEYYNFKIEDDDFPCDWPLSFYVNEEMITKSWGLGDLFPIESQVRELDKTRTQQVNHRKRFNRKYIVTKGSLDAKGINQLKNPEDGTVIEAARGDAALAVHPLQDMPMSPDVYNVNSIITEDIQVIGPLGSNAIVHGVGKQQDTLGQSQQVEQSSNTRLADKQRQLSAFILRIYKMTAQYIQQYWGEEMDMLIAGTGSNPSDWMTFIPQQVQAEFEYDVVPESMTDNSIVYRNQVQQALTTVVPLLRLASVNPPVAIMLRKYLQTFETFKNDVDDIVPESMKQPQQNAEPLNPIPTERISFGVQLADFPVGVQIKGLAVLGIQVTQEDFAPIPGTLEQNTLVPAPDTSTQVTASGQAIPAGLTPEQQQILHQIDQTSPQQFIDSLGKLPDNERQTILKQVQIVMEAVKKQQPVQPGQETRTIPPAANNPQALPTKI